MFFKVNKGNYTTWCSKTFEEMTDYLSSFEFKEHEILRMLNYCKEHKNCVIQSMEK